MNKVWNGRLIFVLVVTALCLYFVYPTFRYFNFVRGMSEDPTVEQLEEQRHMLENASMIKFGLDLQGGVDFLIEVDTERLLEQKMNETASIIREDFRFESVDGTVTVSEDGEQIQVTVTDVEDVKIAELILEDYISEGSLETDNLGALEGGGTVVLSKPESERSRIQNDSVDAALKTVNNRVNEYGLTQPVVAKQPPNRIRVQIPGETDPQRIREGLLKTANLEFRLLHPNHSALVNQFIVPGSNQYGTGIVRPEFLEEVESEDIVGATEMRLKDEIPGVPAGYELFLGEEKTILDSGEVEVVENLVYILREVPELTGANLRRAAAITDPQDLENPYKVTLQFDPEGADKFADVTTENTGRAFAIQLDETVVSAPMINEPILGGRCEISGRFTNQEALDLALVLKAGSLPAPLRVVNEQTVGASMGADSVRASGVALMIGGVIVIILMLVIYQTAGAIACVAMLLNVLLILAILSLADATLTLSGIGGILLTMGMAVDANVLIYERLREELDSGKGIRGALNAAFGRAFSVILDSNVTTLLPALVLILFEIVEGSVRGFWTAMAIGLIANLYTGLTVTRALVDSWIVKKKAINTGKVRLFRNANFNFMKYRKVGFAFSMSLIAVSLFYLSVHGINPGVDFTGGVVATVRTSDAEIQRADLEQALDDAFADAQVVAILNEPNLFQAMVPQPEEAADLQAVEVKLAGIFSENFGGRAEIVSRQSIDPIVGNEFRQTAFWTVFVASLIILGYVAMRFQFAFGLGAVAALCHDLFVALGIFVLMGHSVTLDIVSALLIILGYSVNDTIVVFDRVRENMTEMYGKGILEILNTSINQTLARTVFTSGTTLAVVLSMLLFGGVGLKDFALILLIGILVGTYSSIFIASTLVYAILRAKERRQGAAAAHGKTKKVRITAPTS